VGPTRSETSLFAVILAWAAALQFVAAFNVGGLFRDEVNTL